METCWKYSKPLHAALRRFILKAYRFQRSSLSCDSHGEDKLNFRSRRQRCISDLSAPSGVLSFSPRPRLTCPRSIQCRECVGCPSCRWRLLRLLPGHMGLLTFRTTKQILPHAGFHNSFECCLSSPRQFLPITP